jgi:hypothetical protein
MYFCDYTAACSGTHKMLKKLFSKKWLLLTNTVTSGGLLALGDGLQQAIERKRGIAVKHDWTRSGS